MPPAACPTTPRACLKTIRCSCKPHFAVYFTSFGCCSPPRRPHSDKIYRKVGLAAHESLFQTSSRKKFPPGLQSSAETGLLRSEGDAEASHILSCRRKTSRSACPRSQPRREGGPKDPNEKLNGGNHACCEQYQHCRHAKAVADQHRGACHQLGYSIHRTFPMPGIIPAVRQSALRRGIEPVRSDSDHPFPQVRRATILKGRSQVSSSSVIWDKISSPENSYKGDEQIDMDHREDEGEQKSFDSQNH